MFFRFFRQVLGVSYIENIFFRMSDILIFCVFPIYQVLVHITLWRGKNEKTVAKLLVDLWIQEEEKLGVKRQEHGVIAGNDGFAT